MRQSNFITKYARLLLQIASGITKYHRLSLQIASDITKCDRLYHKVHQALQSVTVITKWDVQLSISSQQIYIKQETIRFSIDYGYNACIGEIFKTSTFPKFFYILSKCKLSFKTLLNSAVLEHDFIIVTFHISPQLTKKAQE